MQGDTDRWREVLRFNYVRVGCQIHSLAHWREK